MNGVDIQINRERRSRDMTVAEALAGGTGVLSASGIASGRLDAELLLAKVLGWNREQLYVNSERGLDAVHHERFLALLRRRARCEPMAYITGQREFWSLDFTLTPAVLVPRPETELLVEETLRQLEKLEGDIEFPHRQPGFRILDIGTGCGVVAVSLARERKDVEVWATDLSSAALEVAQSNARRHGVAERIRFFHGNLFEPLKEHRGAFHGIVSNPPYVNQRQMESLSPEVRWEPKMALEAGPEGLDFYRRIIPRAHDYLMDLGFVALEMGSDMGGELRAMFAAVGKYSAASVQRDYTGRERVISAQRKESSQVTS